MTFDNELYALGNFQKCGNISVSNIAKWNDKVWSPVNNGVKSKLTYTAAVYQNELIVGGEIDSVDNIYSPYSATWNGTKWSQGKFMLDAEPYCFYNLNNNLYVGGVLKSANNQTVNGIFMWDGTKVHSLGSGVNGRVSSIIKY